MNKAKQRQLVLKSMRNIFYEINSPRYDWMGYYITEDNKPSYHHIVKREQLKQKGESIEATVDNGAYLGKRSHEMLHQIELLDKGLYTCWNDLFMMINNMKRYPIEDVWNMVYLLQTRSEELINNDKSLKNRTKKAK